MFVCMSFFIWMFMFFLHYCISLWLIMTRGHMHPRFRFISLHYRSCPHVLVQDTEPSSCHDSEHQLDIWNVKLQSSLPSRRWVTQGCVGVQWLRLFGAMTSVLLEEMERRKKKEKKKRRVRAGLLKAALQNIMLQLNRERWEERLMGRVKGKQLQHRESLSWSMAKGISSLPPNR